MSWSGDPNLVLPVATAVGSVTPKDDKTQLGRKREKLYI